MNSPKEAEIDDKETLRRLATSDRPSAPIYAAYYELRYGEPVEDNGREAAQ